MTHSKLDDDVDANERVKAGRSVDVQDEKDESRAREEAAGLEDGQRNTEVRVVATSADGAATSVPDLAGDQEGNANVDDKIQRPRSETPVTDGLILKGGTVEVLGNSEDGDGSVTGFHEELTKGIREDGRYNDERQLTGRTAIFQLLPQTAYNRQMRTRSWMSTYEGKRARYEAADK